MSPTRTNVGILTITGIAGDNLRVGKVYVKVNSGAFHLATGTTSWSDSITIAAGTNRIYATCVDSAGNIGSTNTTQIVYINPVVVTFDSQGGSTVPVLQAFSNYIFTEPVMPSKSGYSFSGWYRNSNYTSVWNFTSDKAVGAVTLYAMWIPNTSYTDNGSTITFTQYTGTDKNVVIPQTINGKPVVAIANNAFYNKSSITNIILPSGITSIGINAFKLCSGLTNMILPDSVTSNRT